MDRARLFGSIRALWGPLEPQTCTAGSLGVACRASTTPNYDSAHGDVVFDLAEVWGQAKRRNAKYEYMQFSQLVKKKAECQHMLGCVLTAYGPKPPPRLWFRTSSSVSFRTMRGGAGCAIPLEGRGRWRTRVAWLALLLLPVACRRRDGGTLERVRGGLYGTRGTATYSWLRAGGAFREDEALEFAMRTDVPRRRGQTRDRKYE